MGVNVSFLRRTAVCIFVHTEIYVVVFEVVYTLYSEKVDDINVFSTIQDNILGNRFAI